MKYLSIVLGCALLLAGCAVGNRFDYASVRTSALAPGNGRSVAVASIDRRDYLLKGEIDDFYVGMTRGGFGIPYRVSTRSGAPLAEDISRAVAGSLNEAGYKAKEVTSFPVKERDAAVARLKATGAKRLILITLQEWESDTLVKTELTFRVTIEVLGNDGKVIATDTQSGVKYLGGDAVNPIIHARKSVLNETEKIVKALLSSPKISAALRS